MERTKSALQDLKKYKPTASWKESMNGSFPDDGDEPVFTAKAISEYEDILAF